MKQLRRTAVCLTAALDCDVSFREKSSERKLSVPFVRQSFGNRGNNTSVDTPPLNKAGKNVKVFTT
jgi:hypothetical protein